MFRLSESSVVEDARAALVWISDKLGEDVKVTQQIVIYSTFFFCRMRYRIKFKLCFLRKVI